MKKPVRLIVIALSLLFTACAHQAGPGRETTLTVGGASIQVPSPAGYTEVSRDSPRVMDYFRTFTPPTNTLLAVYYSDADAQRHRAGTRPVLNTYAMVQIHQRAHGQDMSPAQFGMMRDLIRTQQQKLLERGRTRANELLRQRRQRISGQVGADLDLSVEDMAVRGVFIDNDRVIGMVVVNRYNVTADGVPRTFRVVGASSVIHVKNKPLLVYVFERYESEASVENARRISRRWVDDILRRNAAP